MARITEAEIAEIVVAILEEGSGEATIAELIKEIRAELCYPRNLAPSTTRRGEAVWEQQVRNITSHKGSPGNAIHDGKLVAISGGLGLAVKIEA